MTRKILSSLLLCSALILSSCESDETTSQTVAPGKLAINPSSLEGEQYVSYDFRAKVGNVPFSDVIFEWDFDEGQGFQVRGEQIVTNVFFEPKIHYVRVRATDYYTSQVLGIDSIRTDIRPPALSFTIDQSPVDTVLPMQSTGAMAASLQLSVTTSTPPEFVTFVWDFRDGTPPETVQGGKYSMHVFAAAGTFVVHVEGHDHTGLFLGSDSITVTLRLPMIAFSSIKFSKGVSVFLAVDSTYPVFKDSLFQNPFSTKLDFKNDEHSSFNTTDPQFTVTLDSAQNVGDNSRFHSIQDRITGELSADGMSLLSLGVTINDTGRINRGTGRLSALHYAYMLKNLELLAVTSTKIVYRSRSSIVSDFASDIQFKAFGDKNLPAGVLDDFRFENIHPEEEKKEGPFALVIFHR
jgi:hypothetical protein